MRTLSVRGLTEGAILAALVAVLALAARYVPLIGTVSALICPIPLTMVVIRHGARAGLLAALVAALVAWMLAGDILLGVGILIAFAPMGLVLGVGVRRNLAAAPILLIASAVGAVSILANVGLTLLVADVNLFQVMVEGMREGQATAIELYERIGISQAQIEQASGMTRQMLEVLPKLLPLSVVLGGGLLAYVNFSVARTVLRKFGHTITAAPPVTTWQVPAVLMWLLPLGVGFIVAGRDRYALMEVAGLNLTMLAQLLFSFQGMLVGWVLLGRYGAPPFLRAVVISFVFAQPVFGFAAFLLGLADATFGLRRRWAAPGAAS